jgi:intein/homing endonuclease
MPKKIIFSENQIKNIIERYQNGESCAKIGQDYNVKQQTINRLLHKNNVVVSNRKHQFNEDYFKEIDSAEKAYWLGFITADGYVNEDRNFMIIKLQERDKKHLEKFIQAINGDMNMIKSQYHNITGNKQYYAEVNSKKFVNHLKNLNIRQAKSANEHVCKDKIPKEFIKDYIRGLWDGDGHIEEKRINLISSSEVLQFVQEYFNKTCYIPINKICNHCNTHRIFICKNREIALHHIYYNNCIALDRKYNFVIEQYK